MKRLLPAALFAGLSESKSFAYDNTSENAPNSLNNLASPITYKKKNNVPNDSEIIRLAINHCISSGMPLDLRGGPWTITETLDLSGVKSVITDFSGRIYVDPENFKASNSSNFAVIIGNPDVGYKEERTAYNSISGLFLLISKSRKNKLNGLFIKGALLSFDSIRISGFNGSGCFLSSVWDSTFKSISCELCGNIEDYQITINAGGDTSNCLSIDRIQSERAFHKCIFIDAIRSTINTIHAERCTVLTTDDGSDLASGLKYLNLYIKLGNSVLNQLIHDTYTSSKDLSKKEKIAANISSASINLVNSSITSASFRDCLISTRVFLLSQVNSLICKSWYFDESGHFKNSTINNSKISDDLKPNSNISIRDSRISKVYVSNASNSVLFDACDIDEVDSIPTKKGGAEFRSCRIANTNQS